MSRLHVEHLIHPSVCNDANHTKGFIFKVIDSLVKYMGVWKPVISIQSHFDKKLSSEILQKV